MQRVGHIRQDFGAAVLLPGRVAESCRFQQAAQLTRQDRRLGGNVLVEEVVVGIMQKRHCANDFVENHQRRSQQ